MKKNLYQQHLSNDLSRKINTYFYARFSLVQIRRNLNILLVCKDFVPTIRDSLRRKAGLPAGRQVCLPDNISTCIFWVTVLCQKQCLFNKHFKNGFLCVEPVFYLVKYYTMRGIYHI